MMPIGRSRLRILALLGGGRNRIEADIGEENDRAAGEDAGPAVGREGMPVRRMNAMRAANPMKIRIARIFSRTITLFVSADSLIPLTRITVSSITMTNAGQLKPKCQPGS